MPAASRPPDPLILLVLDGFGIGRDPSADAIRAARMPVWRALRDRWPHSILGASEAAVGLPPGQMGNSEVGHLNIGAGRPVLQDLPRIDAAIRDGSFFARPALVEACDIARSTTGRLSIVGLIGPGGVHANDRHLVALVELATRLAVPSVRIHALLDGRDTPPRSALEFVRDLEGRVAAVHPDAAIASVGGRYFAMDRDQRWDRIERGYDAIVHGAGLSARSASEAVAEAYERGESDEFVAPTVMQGVGVGTGLRDGESIIHLNFRADRSRQLTHALVDVAFDAFERAGPDGASEPRDLCVTTMTAYEDGLPVSVAFPPEVVRSLADAWAEAGLRQLHVAETEKYAHVTYFFNGGTEAPHVGEDRILVPSPKVATYDQMPGMSALGVTDAIVHAIHQGEHQVIVANFANPDMVGHTGNWDATVEALEVIDRCLDRIVTAISERDAADPTGPGAVLAITADHGNADELRDRDGQMVTAHSLNPVPFLVSGRAVDGQVLADGVLADVAPTLLEMSGLPIWPEITGHSLLKRPAEAALEP